MTLLTKQQIEALLDGTTQGPWTAVQDADDVGFHIGEGPWLADEDGFDGYHICKTTGFYDGEVSDAALIASAPDLARTALDALARLEDAEAAQALVVDQAIHTALARARSHTKRLSAGSGRADSREAWLLAEECRAIAWEIRALATASGVAALVALRARAEKAESERVSEWNKRRDADGSRDAARAACDSMRAERDDALARLAAAEAERDALNEECDRHCDAAQQADGLRYNAEAEAADLRARLAAAEGRVAALTEAVKAFLWWADQKCPCQNEEPDPCTLCGASVENLEACKAADSTLPPRLLMEARAALAIVTPPADTGEGRT